jgi:glutamine synthetase
VSAPAPGLEVELDKPRDGWTTDDVLKLVATREVRVVSLMHVGGDGWLKTLDFVPRSEKHLRNIIDGGERADGSSLFPGTGIPPDQSDIVLRPRASTAFLDPFASLSTLVLMCHHYGRDGTPLPQSPDTILRRADERLRDEIGIDLWALGEVEYFLGKPWQETDIYGAEDRGYHATAPFVFGQGLRRRALAILADIGVAVKYGHSEVGYIEAKETQGVIWEQHEIELALRPLPVAAEATLLTQWVIRNLAHKNGMRCSTEPMMLEGHAGNGLHFHLTPMQDGDPVEFWQSAEALADPARWLIGGLVQLGGALMAFGNRADGSLQRLAQGKEAPNRIVWGNYDRQALIRLPIVPTDLEGRPVAPPTIEFRLPDGSALPHLLLAGAALAMLRGRDTDDLDRLLERTAVATLAASETRAELPRSFAQVAEALERDRGALEVDHVFPPALIDHQVRRLKAQDLPSLIG